MDKLTYLAQLEHLPWDDLRLFILVAREGSLRKAAARGGVSSATLFRRMADLEKALGGRLLNRVPEGMSLTLLGQRVLGVVEAMFVPVHDLGRLLAEQRADRTFVSITVTQGLGVNWLIPNAASFQQLHPTIGIDFRVSNEVADILRFDSDLGIQMTPPTAQDIMAVKIGRMHFELFASADYLARHGTPQTVEALRNHRFVEQRDGHVDRGHLTNLAGELRSVQIAAKVSGSCGAISAIENGLGIGVLPNYSVAFGNRVVPVGLPLRNHRDIWLTYRGDLRQNQGVAAAIGWIKSMFDPRRWPCFRDDYIAIEDIPLMR
ncbi:hypothetical protein IP69_13615 [Bosea sp. AAP35]|uniref:LysR family transcriptional regulator n=1 Tax=Bosea sp. AAP35 TaxID=1523417 RepID=UPI0006B9E923|nr:LysR family transcriptional regulator [Bosea sp. AAP35]KPF67376.1 hypothetical protein IP69_13615 [Bosea sp. AAP35]